MGVLAWTSKMGGLSTPVTPSNPPLARYYGTPKTHQPPPFQPAIRSHLYLISINQNSSVTPTAALLPDTRRARFCRVIRAR
ncbi:hypothetical protein M3J09_004037 [Ascochyta lentis]